MSRKRNRTIVELELRLGQIFIEGIVLEINEDGIKDIGINWNMLDANNPGLLDIRAGKRTLELTATHLTLLSLISTLNERSLNLMSGGSM